MYESAPVYDLLYEAIGKDYAAEAVVVRDLVTTRRPDAGSLLDVACGTGLHLAYLAQWFAVTGTDLTPSMLAEARRRLPGVRLVEADMRELDLGERFDAVACLFSAIAYMRSRDELGAAVRAMAHHLTPGGVLVVDGWVRPDRWRDDAPASLSTAETDEVKVARVGRTSRDGATSHLELHYVIGTHDRVEHLVEHHALTLFTAEEYTDAFRAAGLTVEVFDSPHADRDRYVGTLAASA